MGSEKWIGSLMGNLETAIDKLAKNVAQVGILGLSASGRETNEARQNYWAQTIIDNSALRLAQVKDQVSLDAWFEKLNKIPSPLKIDFDSISREVASVNNALVEAGIVSQRMAKTLGARVALDQQLEEANKKAHENLQLFGKAVPKPDFKNILELSDRLVQVGALTDFIDDYEYSELSQNNSHENELAGSTPKYGAIKKHCTVCGEVVIARLVTVWVGDMPKDIIRCAAFLAKHDSGISVVYGNGWFVCFENAKDYCFHLEMDYLTRLDIALGGEIQAHTRLFRNHEDIVEILEAAFPSFNLEATDRIETISKNMLGNNLKLSAIYRVKSTDHSMMNAIVANIGIVLLDTQGPILTTDDDSYFEMVARDSQVDDADTIVRGMGWYLWLQNGDLKVLKDSFSGDEIARMLAGVVTKKANS